MHTPLTSLITGICVEKKQPRWNWPDTLWPSKTYISFRMSAKGIKLVGGTRSYVIAWVAGQQRNQRVRISRAKFHSWENNVPACGSLQSAEIDLELVIRFGVDNNPLSVTHIDTSYSWRTRWTLTDLPSIQNAKLSLRDCLLIITLINIAKLPWVVDLHVHRTEPIVMLKSFFWNEGFLSFSVSSCSIRRFEPENEIPPWGLGLRT